MASSQSRERVQPQRLTLPPPRYHGRFSLEQVMRRRRSIRELTNQPLTLSELSQLLWSAQGITHAVGYRASPSAGALYPMEVLAVVGNVTGLDIGLYRYVPPHHALIHLSREDLRQALQQAAYDQTSLVNAGIVLVLCAIYQKTTGKYGQRGVRYVHMEAGHVAQNVYLQATALQLGTVVLGAFADERVKDVLHLKEEEPLYLMPVGKP